MFFTSDALTWMWLGGGLLLIAFEIAWPHFFTSFFGLGAIVVAVLRWAGVLESFFSCFLVWIVISTVLVLTSRHYAKRFLYGETTYTVTDEDLDAAGEVVEVVSTVIAESATGRVRFRGVTWPAISVGRTIQPGEKAKLLFRDNLIWRIEAVIDPRGEAAPTPLKEVDEG
jgi:membrane protein implicated in regulation of membrane protease activity